MEKLDDLNRRLGLIVARGTHADDLDRRRVGAVLAGGASDPELARQLDALSARI